MGDQGHYAYFDANEDQYREDRNRVPGPLIPTAVWIQRPVWILYTRLIGNDHPLANPPWPGWPMRFANPRYYTESATIDPRLLLVLPEDEDAEGETDEEYEQEKGDEGEPDKGDDDDEDDDGGEIRFAPPNDWGAEGYADSAESGVEQPETRSDCSDEESESASDEEGQQEQEHQAEKSAHVEAADESSHEAADEAAKEPAEKVVDSIEQPASACDGGHPDGPFQAEQFTNPACPCGEPDTDDMIQCSNVDAHGGELWFHYSHAGLTNETVPAGSK